MDSQGHWLTGLCGSLNKIPIIQHFLPYCTYASYKAQHFSSINVTREELLLLHTDSHKITPLGRTNRHPPYGSPSRQCRPWRSKPHIGRPAQHQFHDYAWTHFGSLWLWEGKETPLELSHIDGDKCQLALIILILTVSIHPLIIVFPFNCQIHLLCAAYLNMGSNFM